MAETIAGDIIDIEYSDDGGTTWNLIAKTRGTITVSPNVTTADTGMHSNNQTEVAGISEAWEVSFEKLLQSTVAGLQTLGLYDGTALVGYSDVESATEGEVRISVYEDQAAKDAGTAKTQLSFGDFLAVLDEINLEEDDFATAGVTFNVREQPAWTPDPGTTTT